MPVEIRELLVRAGDPTAALSEIAATLPADEFVTALVPALRNLHRLHDLNARGTSTVPGFTRQGLLDLFAAAGLDVATLVPHRDFSVDWVPLPLSPLRLDVESAGTSLAQLDADDLEEITAASWEIWARPAVAQPPACSVVLPVHGHLEMTRRCVEAVLAGVPAAEVVVVDDGSRDETAAWVAGLGDSVTLVRRDRRGGFAQAANVGVRAARGELVAFLHNDAIPDERWLAPLVAALTARPEVAAAGPLLLYGDGRIQAAGLALGPDLVPYPLYRHSSATEPAALSRRAVSALFSVGLVVRRRWFVRVGGFDPTFQQGLEDADLCLRLRARGQSILYCPESTLVHVEGGTEGPRTFVDNALYFRAKWADRLEADDEDVARGDGKDVLRVRARGWHLPRPGNAVVASDAPAPASLWSALVFDESGYANEARNFVLALDNARAPVWLNPFRWPEEASPLPASQHARLLELARAELPSTFVHVCHLVVYYFQRHPRAIANVGRSMWETHMLPPDRVALCNEMDEIWVPSEFNVETFAAAGVRPEKLYKVPCTLETTLYHPDIEPLPIEGAHGFVFLAVFVWAFRKGWDLLVRAYLEEFGPSDDVTLVLGSTPKWSATPESSLGELVTFLRDRGTDLAAQPTIVFQPLGLAPDVMPRLYRAADAYVLPTRGEGWGRPYMEAMTMGLPTIGTAWGGNTEFMNPENSYLIDYELREMPAEAYRDAHLFRGLLWAEPSVEHLRVLMREVYENRQEARARGARARADMLKHYSWEPVAEAVMTRLRALGGC